jgi:hypothetical protein
MHVISWDCSVCKEVTPHVEDLVPDKESATVWHCMYCGTERRPPENGTPNEGANRFPPRPVRPNKDAIFTR